MQSTVTKNYAPADATYLTQTANPNLDNEQAMASLATGYRKNTAGVQSVQAIPFPIADGGTNQTALTAGSIVFADGTRVQQDNSNFFWQDTFKQIYLGGAAPDIVLTANGETTLNEQGATLTELLKIEGSGTPQLVRFQNASIFLGGANINTIASLSSAGVALNEGGLDNDVRVEGDTEPSLLHTDASADMVGIKTSTPHSTLDVRGGISLPLRTVNQSNATLGVNDFALLMDTTTVTRQVALPATDTCGGAKFLIKKIDSGVGGVLLLPNGLNTINEMATVTILTQWGRVWMQSNGLSGASGNWMILGSSL